MRQENQYVDVSDGTKSVADSPLPKGLTLRRGVYFVQFKASTGRFRLQSVGRNLPNALREHARLRSRPGTVSLPELTEHYLKRLESYAKKTSIDCARCSCGHLDRFFGPADRIKRGAYHLIILDSENRKVSVQPYPLTRLDQANVAYAAAEQRITAGERIDVVLVSAGPVDALMKAYPNYFLDTQAFVQQIEKVIEEARPKRASGPARNGRVSPADRAKARSLSSLLHPLPVDTRLRADDLRATAHVVSLHRRVLLGNPVLPSKSLSCGSPSPPSPSRLRSSNHDLGIVVLEGRPAPLCPPSRRASAAATVVGTIVCPVGENRDARLLHPPKAV